MLLLLNGCSSLPSLEGRTVSAAFTDTADTRLGRSVARLAAAHPGSSGVYPLLDSREAFAARVLLARAADRSLDVQYYIWHADLSGTLLLEALLEAAGRGVRVRLLLDDNGVSGLDQTLAALDAHPNIEVRLFNPFPWRRLRWLGYLTDFARLNRRMHNKSFTADNQATIVGGRNVGDEYFDAGEGALFVDLDVLAAGPVAQQVSADFDRYWASGSSYPAARLLPAAGAAPQPAGNGAQRAAYLDAVRDTPFVEQLIEGTLPLEWVRAQLVSDDPAKGLGKADPGMLLPERLGELIGEPRAEVELVSAYFVPAENGTRLFAGMAERGVKVTVLTNALEATDVAVVHAGYAKRRKALLAAGVRLFELKAVSPASQSGRGLVGSSGSSASSLHAKTFAVDGARVFIGSFNFDPRSAHLNTEMGLVIDSPAMARRIAESFAQAIPQRSYEVRLTPEGGLSWIERNGREEVRHDTEPNTGFIKRLSVRLLSLLPIDWLL
jgi:putative cardiolipin synthase